MHERGQPLTPPWKEGEEGEVGVLYGDPLCTERVMKMILSKKGSGSACVKA